MYELKTRAKFFNMVRRFQFSVQSVLETRIFKGKKNTLIGAKTIYYSSSLASRLVQLKTSQLKEYDPQNIEGEENNRGFTVLFELRFQVTKTQKEEKITGASPCICVFSQIVQKCDDNANGGVQYSVPYQVCVKSALEHPKNPPSIKL